MQMARPCHGRRNDERLAATQRDLARKRRGSNLRRATWERVVALHGKVRRQRLDHAGAGSVIVATPAWTAGHCAQQNRVTQADFANVACGFAGTPTWSARQMLSGPGWPSARLSAQRS
ncbi:hypothetical protein ACFO1B_15945 [Dactylosporangium siamense]|uniref:Uncharacterized protein n=1 Tax=Dactylosporangium siamense TaxID=685454 RepID=A0A919PIB3_9ACTN|nr:hypothetical protein [Dactylosporangium siamense]GIG45331.1 hypothetical protein Dsi01nite_033720 [Dactylosporangium siamense]